MTDDESQAPDATEEEQDPRQSTEQESRNSTPADQPHPYLRIVKGDATPEEIAALVAVLAAAGPSDAPPPRRTPEWSAHHRLHRVSFPSGPNGWRSSGLPR
jgi:hypothetical protein